MKKTARILFCLCLLLMCMGIVCMAETVDGASRMNLSYRIVPDKDYIFSLSEYKYEWFMFNTDDDLAYYRIDSKNEEVNTSVYMELFDENGISIKRVDYSKGNKGYISFKAERNKTYYVRFSRYNDKYSGRVTMKLTKSVDIYENTIAKAHLTEYGKTTITTFDGSGDIDCFYFKTRPGNSFYRIEFKNDNVDTTLYMELFDKDGLSIEKKDVSKGQSGYISFKAESNTIYYLKFYRYNGEKNGKYSFCFEQFNDYEGDTIETAHEITLKSAVQGSFDGTGDVDVFGFKTEPGSAFYQAKIENENVNTTVYLELFDQNGLSVSKIEASKGNSRSVSWKVNPEEMYYLKITRYDKVRNGRYIVSIARTPDNEPDSFENASSVNLFDRVDASFDGTADVDVFKVRIDEDSVYFRVDFKNENVNTTMYLEIFNESENSLAKAEVSKGHEKFISLKANAGDTYYLKFYRYDKNQTGKYFYTLSKRADKEADASSEAQAFVAGEKMTGAFDGMDDEDWFACAAEEGNIFYELKFKNENLNTTMYAEICDENGYKLYKGEASKGKEKSIHWSGLEAKCAYVRFYLYDKTVLGDYTFELIRRTDVGGNSPETAYQIVPGEEALITLDEQKDIDYIAFSDDSAAILVVNRHQNTAYAGLVDSYGQLIGEEKRLRKGESASFKKDGSAECVRVRTEGDMVYAYCCTQETHMPGGEWKELSSATCETEGITVMMCMVCGETALENVTPRKMHESGEWTVLRLADCEEKGVEVRKCVNCNYETERRETEAVGHAYGEWYVEIEPGCMVDGLQKQTCTECSKVIKIEKIPAFGHIGGEWIIEGGTDCETDASKTRFCRLCGEIMESQKTEAIGHVKGEAEIIVYPTCTEDGVQAVTCVHCKKALEESAIPASGHMFGEWEVVEEATYTKEGLEERTCENCGEKEERAIERKSLKGGLFGN